MNRLSAVLLVIAAPAGFLGGCSPADEPAGAGPATAESVLRRGNGGEPGSLDPTLAEDIHAFNILADLYEGLVTTDAAGRIVPGVAESWSVSDDGLQYRFVLRPDARWSNGDPVTPGDFVRAFQHAANPATLSSYAFLLEPVAGFTSVKAGDAPPEQLGIEETVDEALVIRLERPAPYWLSILSMPIASPRHREEADVTNGPYRLDARESLGITRLVRNPHFHAADSVSIARVDYYPIVDESAELSRFRAGELDVTHTIPPNQLPSLQETMPGQLRVAPMLALYYLAFDLTDTPFDTPGLRKALSLAIDRDALVRVLGRGELPAYGIVPPGTANYDSVAYPWSELDQPGRIRLARELVAKSGYRDDGRLSVSLLYDAGGVHERIAVAVADMWRQHLGIDVRFDKREWMYFLEARKDHDQWDVMRFSWFGDFDDPATFLDIFRSDSPQNLPGYQNAAYDSLLAQADQEKDLERRAGILAEAETALLADYPVVPLYFFVSKHLVADRVEGFEENVLDRHPSRYLSLGQPTER